MAKRKREDDSLREAAEKLISSGKAMVVPTKATDIESLLHELSVHQVELEAQNENLRRAQRQVEEAQEHYSLLFHDAPVAYFVLDDEGIIKEVNREGQRLIGLPAPMLVGMHLRTYLSGESALTFKRHLAESLATNEKQRCEVMLANWATREPVNVLVESISLSSVSGENRVRSAFVNVTEKKRAEEGVRQRTEALRWQAELLEASHEAIFVKDLDGRIVYWSKGAEETYGWTKAEATGSATHSLLQTQFPVPFNEYMPMLIEKGRWEGELLHTRKDGQRIRVLSRHALQMDEAGMPTRIFEINFDITAARSLEEQLRQAQKMEALGTLTGGIAHDFNNVLAVIISFTELLKEEIPSGSGLQEGLSMVFESALRGRDLVRRMLTFARQSKPEKRPISLAGIVREATAFLRASIPVTVAFEVRIAHEPGSVLGDPVQLEQVVINLCTNAAYAMRVKGGTLTVELSEFVGSEQDPHGIAPGSYMTLAVRDTGEGIPPENLEKIFDPFFTTKGPGGTGLGLSVVHGIVTSHGGYLLAESAPGKGSIFTVYLPRAAEGIANQEESEEAVPTGCERILFVDDEASIARVGQKILEGLGYRVTAVTSSAEALALFTEDPAGFDLVITDQTMPEMTGMELARELLSLRPDIPIILCTGFSYLVDAPTAHAGGIRAFAMKPLTRREIGRTVKRVLGR